MDNNFYQQLYVEKGALEAQMAKLGKKLDAVKVLMEDYKEEQKPFRPVIESGIPMSVKKAGRPKKEGQGAIYFPIEYDKGLIQKQKVYIALYQLGSGYSKDIANRLRELDPVEFAGERATKVAKEKSSDLYLSGVFGAQKHGRKHKYYIKQKATV